MDRRNSALAAAEFLKSARRVLIVTHKNPDGDAVGSALALEEGLNSLGIETRNLNVDPMPKALQWLTGTERAIAVQDSEFVPDTLLILDCNSIARTGFPEETFAGIPRRIVVDHHLSDGPVPPGSLIDSTAPASGTLVWELLQALGAAITPSQAEALYVALHTDTGGFRFGNTDAGAFVLAANLVERGARPAHVAQMLLEREDPSRLKLLGLALATLTVVLRGRVAFVRVDLSMFRDTDTSDEHTDGFVNYPRAVDGVEVAILFKEKAPGLWRVALRSKGAIDVASAASRFGGGGHRNAAGATLEGGFDEVSSTILDAIADRLEISPS